MKVFVSFTGADREVKNRVVEALRTALDPEDVVWESDESCMSNYAEESIANIDVSQVFVVLLSKDAVNPRSYVSSEVHFAHKCEMAGKLNIVLFRLDSCELTHFLEMNLGHISDANHLARTIYNDDSGIPSLVKKVKRLLDLRRMGMPEKPYDIIEPELNSVAFGGMQYFVEGSRNKEFEAVRSGFERSNVVIIRGIQGYGRRSLLREYARLRKEEFRKVLSFPQYSGTLTDFFALGLEITNVNPIIFDKSNTKQLILEKKRILSKFDETTMLVLSDITFGKEDDNFIFDVVSDLKCRIAIITQGVSRLAAERFPVIDVGRMDDACLEKLFYNYYSFGEEVCSQLAPALAGFFSALDGHTLTVELAAKTLFDEYIYPEEAAGRLAALATGENDELSEKILRSLSEFLTIKNFDEVQQQILYCAALMLRQPMDEPRFIKLLKDCGCFDPGKLRMLVEARWIIDDRSARLTSMMPLICSVCFARLPRSERILTECVSSIVRSSNSALANANVGDIWPEGLRAVSLFSEFGLVNCSAFISEVLSLMIVDDKELLHASASRIQELHSKAVLECRALTNDDFSDAVFDYIETLNSLLDAVRTADLIKSNVLPGGIGFENEGLFPDQQELVLTIGSLARYADDAEERQFAQRLLKLFTQTNVNGTAVQIYALIDMFNENRAVVSRLFDGDAETMFCGSVVAVVSRLVMVSHSPFLSLSIIQRAEELLDEVGCVSPGMRFSLLADKLNVLTACSAPFDEVADCYHKLISLFYSSSSKLFISQKAADEFFFRITSDFIASCIGSNKTEPAAEACVKLLSSSVSSPDAIEVRIDRAAELTSCMLKNGETSEAVSFLTQALELLDPAKVQAFPSQEAKENYLQAVESLSVTLNTLRDPNYVPSFTDGIEKYYKYYTAYCTGGTQSGRYDRYSGIARKAQTVDLTQESDEELADNICKLRQLAAEGNDIWRIVPYALALVSEACYRALGYRLHFVQLVGACAIFDGQAAEIQNGEGKTVTIAAAAVLSALPGRQVFVLDSSAYLTKRNFAWMRGIFDLLGCSAVYLEFDSSADQRQDLGRSFGDADIIYITTFDLALFAMLQQRARTAADFDSIRYETAIIDEIDETAIIRLSTVRFTSSVGSSSKRTYVMNKIAKTVKGIGPCIEDYAVLSGQGKQLKPRFYELVRSLAQELSFSAESAEYSKLNDAVIEAVSAFYFSEKGRDYFIREAGGRQTVMVEDRLSGELIKPGPAYRYFISVKEGLPVGEETDSRLINSVHLFSLLKRFSRLSGASATVSSYTDELSRLYGLKVFRVPPNVPTQRIENPPRVFFSEKQKCRSIVELAAEKAKKQQPVLIVCGNIYESKLISKLFTAAGIVHSVLNAENAEQDPEVLIHAGELGKVTVSTAIANHGVDICLGGDPLFYAKETLVNSGISSDLVVKAQFSADSSDPELTRIRSRLRGLAAVYHRDFSKKRELIESLGGLCVIGTTCFDTLRTEQQMRGRCGRQGSPGESFVFYSFEDPTLRDLLGSSYEMIKRTMGTFVDDADISSGMLIRSIARAREKRQQLRFQQLLSIPDYTFCEPVRKTLFGNARELISEDFDMRKHIVGILAKDDALLEALKEIRRGEYDFSAPSIEPVSVSALRFRYRMLKIFLGALRPCISSESIPSRKAKMPEYLMDVIEERIRANSPVSGTVGNEEKPADIMHAKQLYQHGSSLSVFFGINIIELMDSYFAEIYLTGMDELNIGSTAMNSTAMKQAKAISDQLCEATLICSVEALLTRMLRIKLL